MSIEQAVVLGLIQGITEFLPVSSSGHLIALPNLFGWEQQGADFDVMIHVATLLAILWVMRKDLGQTIRGVTQKASKSFLAWQLVVATLPVVVVGFLISGDTLAAVRVVQVVAANLVIWGVVLWVADAYAARRKKVVKDVQKTSWPQAVMIGVAQAAALFPGTSRSGITISAGLFAGLSRDTAARFSFLLAVPAILGAGFLVGMEAVEVGFSTPISALIVGFISAFASGALAIHFLFSLLKRASYKWFAFYRIALGVMLLLFFTSSS